MVIVNTYHGNFRGSFAIQKILWFLLKPVCSNKIVSQNVYFKRFQSRQILVKIANYAIVSVPGCSVGNAHCFVKFCSITRVCIPLKLIMLVFIVYEMIFCKIFFLRARFCFLMRLILSAETCDCQHTILDMLYLKLYLANLVVHNLKLIS